MKPISLKKMNFFLSGIFFNDMGVPNFANWPSAQIPISTNPIENQIEIQLQMFWYKSGIC